MEINDQRTLVATADGSNTIFDARTGEHYHSRHGAIGESRHVFLGMGLRHFLDSNPGKPHVTLVEVGFGTGLNFLLSAEYCDSKGVNLDYHGVEAYPLEFEMIAGLGYDRYIPDQLWNGFLKNYSQAFHADVPLGKHSSFRIYPQKVLDFMPPKADVVYFDAFSATHQPEMWSDEVLRHVAGMMNPGGIFVTYSVTGSLKRSMRKLGFSIEKLPGAPGKREMLRAVKV